VIDAALTSDFDELCNSMVINHDYIAEVAVAAVEEVDAMVVEVAEEDGERFSVSRKKSNRGVTNLNESSLTN